ncbi:MAG TPA: ABC transporter permease, partial [Sedimentibacter sp.]|nr:ABC transporter permease [Sedimentibacter sp.]
MMNSILRNKNKLLIILFWIFVWEILSLIIAQEIYLPSPHAAFSALMNLLISKDTYITIYYSTYRTLTGFFLSCVFGIFLGIISGIH